MAEVTIGTRKVGDKHPVFIVAELSANHLQRFDLALRLIDAAKEAGADAIKLQTYTPDTITINSDKEYFQIKQGTIWDGTTLYKLYEEAYTPWDWQPKLKEYAESLGLVCFSAPFDPTAVDFLEKMHNPAYKVASFEITDTPLIKYMASKGKPMIISTGIATREDINEAVETCRTAGNDQIILLKCTSAYPTPLSDVNLRTIPDIATRYNTLVGLSDHSIGISVPIAAVSLGACLVEKHLIIDRSQGGPDAAFSLEPAEFKEMVTAIRQVEEALGTANYNLTDKMKRSREFARSLFAIKDIMQGETLTEENVRSVRPAYGLPPRFLDKVIGMRAKVEIEKGTPLSWEIIE
ncbi:MAG: pseudaminic acid synthase [Candidatus Thorarchaeota archaeon]